ncbi:IclR family transcriptional regulator domain-containing protein [Leptothrix sp. BB-4]
MTLERLPVDRSLLIEGLGKGLRVIEAFSDDWPRMTATECGERTGMTRTAARRYLMSLVHYGYADTDGKHYWLMPSVLRLGQSYLEAARLPRLVQPFLQRLSMHTGETANFSVLDGHEVVYLVRSNSPRVVSIGFQVGARMPAHAVSPGTAVLSTWSPEALEAWLSAHDFLKFNASTVADADRLRERVERARAQGWIRIEQQVDVGLGGLAVPLQDRKGRCVGALSITFQAQTFPEDTCLQRLLPPLQEAAQQLRPIV